LRRIESKDDRRHGIDRRAADPRLNAKPAAGDERAHERRDIRAQRPKGSADQHGEGDAVGRPRVRVERHRDEHNQVAEKDRQDGLFPVHTLLDEAAGQGVGRDANRHSHPKRGDAPHRPSAPARRDGREIVIDQRCGFEQGRERIGLRSGRSSHAVGHPASSSARESSDSFSRNALVPTYRTACQP